MSIKTRMNNLFISMSGTITFFLYGPLELFYSNYEDFQINWLLFILLIFCLFLLVSSFLYLLGIFASRISNNCLYIFHSLIISIGILFFIQGNILSIDVGLMTGGVVGWENYRGHFYKDALIWLTVLFIFIIVPIVIKAKWEKIIIIVSRLFVITQLLSLVIISVMFGVSRKDIDTYMAYNVNLETVSKDENVIVFLLDMFDARYMDGLLENGEEIKEILDGFTYFDNCTGVYSTTDYSVCSLLSGQLFANDAKSFVTMYQNSYKKNRLFPAMIEDGYVFDLFTNSSYIPNDLIYATTNCFSEKSLGIKINKIPDFICDLLKFVGCKYLPDCIKPYIWITKNPFLKYRYSYKKQTECYSVENIDFLDYISTHSIKTSDEKRFKFIHLDAVHYPYTTDENMMKITATNDEYQAYLTALGVLRMLGVYIEQLKATNVYDNSLIILIADHGYYNEGTLCSPMMAVKQINSHKDFSISSAPVSSLDFQATISSEIIGKENCSYLVENGESVFNISENEQRNRFFYQYYLSERDETGLSRLIEYEVDSEGRERSNFHITNREISQDGNVIQHDDDCCICSIEGIHSTDATVNENIPHYKVNK